MPNFATTRTGKDKHMHLLGLLYYSQAKKPVFIAQLLPIRLIFTLSAAAAVLAAEQK